jgi:hypothetical protein
LNITTAKRSCYEKFILLGEQPKFFAQNMLFSQAKTHRFVIRTKKFPNRYPHVLTYGKFTGDGLLSESCSTTSKFPLFDSTFCAVSCGNVDEVSIFVLSLSLVSCAGVGVGVDVVSVPEVSGFVSALVASGFGFSAVLISIGVASSLGSFFSEKKWHRQLKIFDYGIAKSTEFGLVEIIRFVSNSPHTIV